MRTLISISLTFLFLSMLGCNKQKSERQIPTLGKVANFHLRDQDGQPLTPQKLEGSYWVANFIFTSCPTFCPMLTGQMASLQREMQQEKANIFFVSFSVDPETDTPEKLKTFANKYKADLSNWFFVTGDIAETKKTVVDGFKLAVGEKTPLKNGGYDITHAKYFVLVDPKGNIRGYYRSDPEHQQKIIDDIEYLLKKGKVTP